MAINHDHHHPETHDHYHYPVHPHLPCAPDCDDQLPTFSTVGRGIQGNSYRVRVIYQDTDETYLVGETFDEASQSWSYDPKFNEGEPERTTAQGIVLPAGSSKNIHGGELLVRYNYYPNNEVPYFTQTFHYSHPDWDEWTITSPAIPYLVDSTDAGKGASVGNVWVSDDKENGEWNWRDVLKFPNHPKGWDGSDWNAPQPPDDWSATITFGMTEDADVKVPTLDDLAKLIGTDGDTIWNFFINGGSLYPDGNYDNLKDYIDQQDKKIKDVIQPPAEWLDPGTNLPGDGDPDGFGDGTNETIWEKFRAFIIEVRNKFTDIDNKLDTSDNVTIAFPPLLGKTIQLTTLTSYNGIFDSSTAILRSSGIQLNFNADLNAAGFNQGQYPAIDNLTNGLQKRVLASVPYDWAGGICTFTLPTNPPSDYTSEEWQEILDWWDNHLFTRSRFDVVLGGADFSGPLAVGNWYAENWHLIVEPYHPIGNTDRSIRFGALSSGNAEVGMIPYTNLYANGTGAFIFSIFIPF